MNGIVEVLWDVFSLDLPHTGEYSFGEPIGSPQASTWLTNAIREVVSIDGLVMDHGIDKVIFLFGLCSFFVHVPLDDRVPHALQDVYAQFLRIHGCLSSSPIQKTSVLVVTFALGVKSLQHRLT